LLSNTFIKIAQFEAANQGPDMLTIVKEIGHKEASASPRLICMYGKQWESFHDSHSSPFLLIQALHKSGDYHAIKS
jgi:hypothetical protein